MKKSLPSLLFIFFYIGLFGQSNCRQEEYQRQYFQFHHNLPVTNTQQTGHSKVFYVKLGGTDTGKPFNAIVKYPFIIKHPLFGGHTDTVISHPVPDKIIIPVVVHILWNNARQNISVAQVLSQIDVLNQDYNGTNSDRNKIPTYFSALAASCGISFALAKTDPQGHPTNGIVRKQTGIAIFNFDDKVKSSVTGGDDAWNANHYLNIWVCNLENGISGYASVPGGAKEDDGVVISTGVFGTINISGPFNKGRTATHEIGHWLNLRHIWGDASCGDDQVDDTPTQQAANRGCQTGEKFTCGSTAHGDMYMNYMDFTDDGCMYMFTKGQQKRMRALFETGGIRNALLYSGALDGEGLPLRDTATDKLAGFDVLLYPNPAISGIMIDIKSATTPIGSKIYVCNQLGQTVKIFMCNSKLQQLDISSLPAGLYFIKMDAVQAGAMKKFVKQ